MVIRVKHGKGSDRITLPDNWQGVTWEQMSQLRKGVNYCEVFTGIPVSDWKSKGATRAYIRLNHLLSWSHSPPDWDTTDFKMKVGGNEINFKSIKLQTESIGQYMDVEITIRQFREKNRKDKDLARLYPVVIAIYADGHLHKKYDYDRAMKTVGEIKAQPYQKVNNIGGFFLTNMMVFTGGGNLLWLLSTYLKRKWMRAFPLLTISTRRWQP